MAGEKKAAADALSNNIRWAKSCVERGDTRAALDYLNAAQDLAATEILDPDKAWGEVVAHAAICSTSHGATHNGERDRRDCWTTRLHEILYDGAAS